MTTSVTERVAKGAAFLDSVIPGWDERIVTGTLDIASWSRCVLGQLYGGYDKGKEALGLTDEDVYNYAIDGDVHVDAPERTLVWRDLIATRRRARLTLPADLLAVPV